MQQLSGLDASFLALETANTTGHVGGLSILDPSDAPAPLNLARLTEVMAERLPLVPVASLRQAAARNPRWETVILPGVGHTPQLEVPGKVIGTMRDWLGRHFAPAAG